MRVFSCKVLLSGSRYNEVVKPEVTIPEIYVLRHIHGDDSVIDIKPLGREAFDNIAGGGRVMRTDRTERERLHKLYDPRKKLLDKLFGVGQPLPSVLEGVDDIAQTEPVRRTRKPVDPVAEAVA
jgi:hypothetical protein